MKVTKSPRAEIEYLAEMLTATMPEDVGRLCSIGARLTQIAGQQDDDEYLHAEAATVLEACRDHSAESRTGEDFDGECIYAFGVEHDTPDGPYVVAVHVREGRIVDVLPVGVLEVEECGECDGRSQIRETGGVDVECAKCGGTGQNRQTRRPDTVDGEEEADGAGQ